MANEVAKKMLKESGLDKETICDLFEMYQEEKQDKSENSAIEYLHSLIRDVKAEKETAKPKTQTLEEKYASSLHKVAYIALERAKLYHHEKDTMLEQYKVMAKNQSLAIADAWILEEVKRKEAVSSYGKE